MNSIEELIDLLERRNNQHDQIAGDSLVFDTVTSAQKLERTEIIAMLRRIQNG